MPVVVPTTTSACASSGSRALVPRSTAAVACGGRRPRPAWRSTRRCATRPVGAAGVDLVVADVVPFPLELDPPEEELRRSLARAGGLEPRETAGEVDEGDSHPAGGYVVAGRYLVPSQAPTHPGALSVRLDV